MCLDTDVRVDKKCFLPRPGRLDAPPVAERLHMRGRECAAKILRTILIFGFACDVPLFLKPAERVSPGIFGLCSAHLRCLRTEIGAEEPTRNIGAA